MLRTIGWCLYAGVLATLAWVLHQELPVAPRCVIEDDFQPHFGNCLNAEGSRLITHSHHTHQFRIWDTHTGKSLGTFLPAGFWNIYAVAPATRFMAVQLNDGPCRIIDVDEGREYSAGCGDLHFSMLSFSPKGRYLWIDERPSEGDGRFFVVEPHTGRVVRTFQQKKDPAGVILGFTAAEHLVFWNDGRCLVRKLPGLEVVFERTLADTAEFADDRRLLLARDGAAGKPWIIWNVVDGSHRTLLDAHGTPFADDTAKPDYKTRFFSPKGDFLAMALEGNKEVGIWDAATGKWERAVPFAWDAWSYGAFSRDGTRLALATRYKQLTMFDRTTGGKLWTHEPSGKWKWNFEFSRRPRRVQLTGRDEWNELDVETGQQLGVSSDRREDVIGDFLVEQEQVEPMLIVEWLMNLVGKEAPLSVHIRVTQVDTKDCVHEMRVPRSRDVWLSENGQSLLVHENDPSRYLIWDVGRRPSALLTFGIPAAIGLAGVALCWGWRAWRGKRSAAANPA